MSFDQRPARATKRVTAPLPAAPQPVQANAQSPQPKPKNDIKAMALFVAAALIGGAATTAAFYGLVPGIGPITLPALSSS